MGCSSSKKFQEKIKQQANKIDELISINEKLQKNLLEMQQKVLQNLTKYNSETGSDLTNLRLNLDLRFARLEKTIERINSMTMKESEKGVSRQRVRSNNGDLDVDDNNFTLSLNFDLENARNAQGTPNQPANEVSQWNKLLNYEINDLSPKRV